MKQINPRSGHGYGPGANDPWYVKFIWCALVAVVMGAEAIGKFFSFIARFFV
jgi:hypothetical protein